MDDATEIPTDPFGWIGETLDGRYRIERIIGSGGFGIVYSAQHLTLGGRVAIKCLDLRAQLDRRKQDAFLRAFQNEGQILHQLASKAPAIVRVMDLSAALSPRGIWAPYLVLEWLDGRSLYDHLAERRKSGERFALSEVIQLLRPIGEALAVAHASGIAHRDVKPGNLFVLANGQMKILDFGIAKIMGDESLFGARYDLTGQNMQAFSPAYGAPEQFEPGPTGLGATGPWTDVYALALVIVEMLTARRAYDGSTSSHFHIQAMKRELRPTPRARGADLGPELERVFERALAVDPRTRYPEMGSFFRDLETAAAAPHASGPTHTKTAAAHSVASEPATAATTTSGAVATAARRSDRTGSPRLRIAAFLTVAVFGVAYGITRLTGDEPQTGSEPEKPEAPRPKKKAPPKPAVETPTSIESIWEGVTVGVDPENDGTSADDPALPVVDAKFVDTREGWGWGDLCWKNLWKDKLGWAKAECIKAMQLPPASPNPRASLLYNLGLIEQKAGHKPLARKLFLASLELREHKEVRAALEALD